MKKIISLIFFVLLSSYSLFAQFFEHSKSNIYYLLSFGRHCSYIEVNKYDMKNRRTIVSNIVYAPNPAKETFFMGTSDYDNDDIVLVTSETGYHFHVYNYNFSDNTLKSLYNYRNHFLYFVAVIDNKLIVYGRDKEKKKNILDIYTKQTRNNYFKKVKTFYNLDFARDEYMFRNRFDETIGTVYIQKNEKHTFKLLELNLKKITIHTIGHIAKSKDENIFLLSVEGDSIAFVKVNGLGQRIYEVYDKKLKSKKFEKSYDIKQKISFQLDNSGGNIILFEVSKTNSINLSSYNLKTKKWTFFQFDSTASEYLKKQTPYFYRDYGNKIYLGHYKVDIKTKSLKRRYLDDSR